MDKCNDNKDVLSKAQPSTPSRHRRQFSIINEDEVFTALQRIKTENADPTPPPSPKLCQAQRTLVAQQKQIIYNEEVINGKS